MRDTRRQTQDARRENAIGADKNSKSNLRQDRNCVRSRGKLYELNQFINSIYSVYRQFCAKVADVY